MRYSGHPEEHLSARQHAVPAAEPFPLGFRSSSGGDGLRSYAEHESLRQRKTPHGTVYEKDYGNLDKHVQVPATKHVLLSTSPNYARGWSQHDYSTPPPHHQYSTYGNQSQFDVYSQGIGMAFGQNPHTPTWDPGGLDSMLNQTQLLPTQRYYIQPNSNVPVVLPGIHQTYFRPTASAGQEYFGNYWPDGTHIPYRPASIRDDRFYTSQLQQYPHQGPAHSPPLLRKPGRLPIGFQQQQLDQQASGPYLQHGEPVQYQPQYPGPMAQNPYNHPNSTYNGPQTQGYRPSPSPAELNMNRALYATPEAESLAFREKTFGWAHRAYADLLTHLQKSALESHSANTAHGGRKAATKMTMFPKPPKRSRSNFSDSTSARSTPAGVMSSHQHPSDNVLNEIPSRPQTAIYSPHRRASETGYFMQGFSVGPSPYAQSFYGPLPHKQDFRRTSDTSVTQATMLDQGTAVRPTAALALENMELLCEQADKPWIDGMLLAGCLAYGLSNHDKALKWYQAILTQDPQHVEAMSNLAATLFALDRRDEALNYWHHAVQLRPSYFEAVEHLIGLLCSSRRAKEAVDLIEFVEAKLKIPFEDALSSADMSFDRDSDVRSNDSNFTASTLPSVDSAQYDYAQDSIDEGFSELWPPGFGSSGYGIPGSENGRMLALIHAKGNMLYALGKNSEAAEAFENAVMIATKFRKQGIRGLIRQILHACLRNLVDGFELQIKLESKDPVLLSPQQAESTALNLFPPTGKLPGLAYITQSIAVKAAVSTTSNSLLSLAKIYQDAMSTATEVGSLRMTSTRDILALYYLSLSLQRSPSTANNVGILLAGVQHSAFAPRLTDKANAPPPLPGVVPGSGVSLALLYYNYGLNLDSKHAHLYTNLGSLLKDIGQLAAAIKMYEQAVGCDPTFDIALANLANAVKDQGRVADAITYYRRAVKANPNFAEAVCGLATALNSVCNWQGRGGVFADNGTRDRFHVDEERRLFEAHHSHGWMNRVVEIVEKQLKEGQGWGVATLTPTVVQTLSHQLTTHLASNGARSALATALQSALQSWAGKPWEGSRIVRLVERAIRRIGWQWYQDLYKERKVYPQQRYARPQLPTALSGPTAPTVLPFHTFTTPLSAKAVRQISQRNALRISVSTLRSAWLPQTVYPPPPPPRPHLNVGYISSDFNNHPLAHLMQSIFGYHNPESVRAVCYATTASDGSIYRAQIEHEAPVFRDASTWSVERLVQQILKDEIHVLINLNGYTRGARNEVFAARPAPIHMSFMGFAGTLGAEWCDYVFADEISVPLSTLSSWRRNVDIEDKLRPDSMMEDAEDWVYSENIIFARDTFFCVDHKQSAPDADNARPSPTLTRDQKDRLWRQELQRRWLLRKEIFPKLGDDAIILGNFNQLYKIDPATFRMYLQILQQVSNAVLWLLRFPDLGEQQLRSFAETWAGKDIASRIVFTDVASKGMHITRASVVDLFLDTPECNAHTTAADVVWSGTPIVTWGRWSYKMCSRMAGSILSSALPETEEGRRAHKELTINVPLPGEQIDAKAERESRGEAGEKEYIAKAVALARGLRYDAARPADAATSANGSTTPELARRALNKEMKRIKQQAAASKSAASPAVDTAPSTTRTGIADTATAHDVVTAAAQDSSSESESSEQGTIEAGQIPELGTAQGRLMEIRRMLWEGRWESKLFDTRRWVRDLERAYWCAWEKWEAGEGGDIWL